MLLPSDVYSYYNEHGGTYPHQNLAQPDSATMEVLLDSAVNLLNGVVNGLLSGDDERGMFEAAEKIDGLMAVHGNYQAAVVLALEWSVYATTGTEGHFPESPDLNAEALFRIFVLTAKERFHDDKWSVAVSMLSSAEPITMKRFLSRMLATAVHAVLLDVKKHSEGRQ